VDAERQLTSFVLSERSRRRPDRRSRPPSRPWTAWPRVSDDPAAKQRGPLGRW